MGRAELEALGRAGGDEHGLAFGRLHELAVAGVARVGHQHLVAGFDERQARELQGGRCTGRHDDARRIDVQAEARRIPATDGFTQRGQAGSLCVLAAAGPNGAFGGCHDGGWGREIGLSDVEVDHGSISLTRLRRHGRSGLGQLHHVERFHALRALGDPHGAGLRAAAGEAATSAGRSWEASWCSTPLTYLWPSVPPNDLASSMHSLSTTRQGTSRQCWNS